MRSVLGRLLHLPLLALGTSLLCFLFLEAAPGNYLTGIQAGTQMSAVSVRAVGEQFDLERPLPVRYGKWLGAVANGTWGTSFQYGRPVSELLWERAGNTLLLTGSALLLTWPVAVAAGVLVAASRSRWVRTIGGLAPALLLSLPDLLVALLLLSLAVRTGLFPTGGMTSIGFEKFTAADKLRDLAAHLLPPAACLALTAFPAVFLHARTAMADALEARFLQAARANGIPRRRLLFRYALPAAANALLSLFGLSLGSLLSSSLVVEVILGWPGLGSLLVDAIQARDAAVVVGATVVSAMAAAGGGLVGDMLLLGADPRIRTEAR